MDNKLKRSTLMLSAILLPCLAVAVLLSVIPTRSVQVQIVIYVDDDTCPAPGSGTQATPYCRIQDAVDAAGPNLPKARLSNLLFTGNSLVSATAEDAVVALDGTFTSLEVECPTLRPLITAL